MVLARPRAVLGPTGAELEEPGPEGAREIARFDARPECLRLLFRDPAVLERLIHLIDRGGLRGVFELLRGDAEVLGDGIEERRGRGIRLGGGDRRAAACNGKAGHGGGENLLRRELAHGASPFGSSSSPR